MSTQNLDYSVVWPEDFFAEDNEEVSESNPHYYLIYYLVSVFNYLFRDEGWFIAANLLITQPTYATVAPDVAVYKTRLSPADKNIRSWSMGQPDHPAPGVVFEIASDATWGRDLNEKIVRYAQMGVQEYFAYDPNTPRSWAGQPSRLRGWSYEAGFARELQFDDQGRLWSAELASYLIADEMYLRFQDRQGRLRPTGEEAEHTARLTEQSARLAEQSARLATEQRLEAEQKKVEAAQVQEEAERQAKEKAWAKLRELGIDPEKI